MRLDLNVPEHWNYKVFLDGKEISEAVRWADDETGEACCFVVLARLPDRPAVINLGRDSNGEPIEVMRCGRVEIYRKVGK